MIDRAEAARRNRQEIRQAEVRVVAPQPRLIAVDDDEAVLELVREVGLACGYDVLTLSSPGSLINAIHQFDPALVILDLAMPEVDGVKLMRRLAQTQCEPRIALLSGAESKTLAAAYRLGAEYGLDMAASFAKPFEATALRDFLIGVRQDLRPFASAELLEALCRDQFEVRYQPKVDLRASTPHVVGAEALVRWRHPSRGVVSAHRFVPIAEREGLIEPLSSWVLSEVVGQLQRWESAGRRLVVAVNLPTTLLVDVDFPDRVEEMLRQAGVPAHRLMLEITERAAMRDGPTAIDVLTRFRLKEVWLSIDDFGVGYSSLIELYRMPFNELKIDASFVRDLSTSKEARTIVKTLVMLAHELGLEACAEGIETAADLDLLRNFGCDRGQGFLFGPAMTVPEFEAALGAEAGTISVAEMETV